MMKSRSQCVEDAVRTIMHNARSIPVRIMQRGSAEGPPGDLSEATSANDMQQFEWVLRTTINRLRRSLEAQRREATKKGQQRPARINRPIMAVEP